MKPCCPRGATEPAAIHAVLGCANIVMSRKREAAGGADVEAGMDNAIPTNQPADPADVIEVLQQAQADIAEALTRARRALGTLSDKQPLHRAEAYWLAHIGAATGQGRHVNRFDVTVQSTIDELGDM